MVDLLKEALESLIGWLDTCSAYQECSEILIFWFTLLIQWLRLF